MSRPSQPLPDGLPKNVSPFGGGTAWKAADIHPVSEFESPKLYMAGKPQPLGAPPLTPTPICPTTNATTSHPNTQTPAGESIEIAQIYLTCQNSCVRMCV